MPLFRRCSIACLALFALLASFSVAQTQPATTQGAEALPRDPNNVYGTFDNGLKYIIRKNANPPGKVAMWLHVRTGALNETDQQNGLAHFTEHMGFNGSAHFPPGRLVPLMSHLGMVFGADSNAHTNLRETVYKLTLPDVKAQTLDTGLTILSDYANGMGLSKIEIDSERRVILEEARARKSAAQRLDKLMNKTVFPDTRLAIHDVIGDEEQIKTFPREQFVDYYNTWYRPENMTLIVAGDIDPDQIIAAAKVKLGDFKARGPAREAMKAGLKPSTQPAAYVLTDPEQVAGDVSAMTLRAGRPIITTFSEFRRDMIDDLASWIVDRRLDEIIRKGGAPFREASVGNEDVEALHEVYDAEIDADGEPQDWNKMLDAQITEISRAIDHGFTQRELDLVKSATLAGAQQAVDTESSRDSTQVVELLASQVGRQDPILSAKQRLELDQRVLDSITLDELHQAFVENFKTKNYNYILSMPQSKEGLKLPTSDDVLAAATAAWAKKTEAPSEQKLAGSLLQTPPDPGTVVSSETDKDLGITTAVFANGAVLHHKFSDYKKDQVIVRITLPGGTLEETAANKGVSEVASQLFMHPATTRFNSTQLRDFLTGKNVDLSGGVGLDAMAVTVSGTPTDLPIGMELLYALFTDGVLEKPAVDEWKQEQHQALAAKKTSPKELLHDALVATTFGDDPRMVALTDEEIDKQDPAAAEQWFKRIASHAAIEVAIVGDIKLDDAIALTAKYIGSLPKRTDDFTALNSLRKTPRGAGPFDKQMSFKGITPMAVVLSGFISCDELSPDRRPLSIAAQILSDRMIERIREKEQLVYSIHCQDVPGHELPGTGMMFAAAPTDPKNADTLDDTIVAMMQDFADKGPTEEELATAKKQIANTLATQMKDPSFWITQIGEMRYRGRSLDDIKQVPQIYQTFTVEQVQGVVKKYLTADSTLKIRIVPATMPSRAPSATTKALSTTAP